MVMPTRWPSTTSKNSGPTGAGRLGGNDLHGVGHRQAGLQAAHHDIDGVGEIVEEYLLAALAQITEEPARQAEHTDRASRKRHIPGHAGKHDREAKPDTENDEPIQKFLHRQLEAGLHQQGPQA